MALWIWHLLGFSLSSFWDQIWESGFDLKSSWFEIKFLFYMNCSFEDGAICWKVFKCTEGFQSSSARSESFYFYPDGIIHKYLMVYPDDILSQKCSLLQISQYHDFLCLCEIKVYLLLCLHLYYTPYIYIYTSVCIEENHVKSH